MIASRWEVGSHFHWGAAPKGTPAFPWRPPVVHFASGRQSLEQLVRFLSSSGRFNPATSRLWIAAYSCAELISPLRAADVTVRTFDGSPGHDWDWPWDQVTQGDIVVLTNYFGWKLYGAQFVPLLQQRGVIVVEDHTQAPLVGPVETSRADYAFASLRKTLPIPDGAVLWSTLRNRLPPQLSAAEFPLNCVMAMFGKRAHLAGGLFGKDNYRALFAEAEQIMNTMLPTGISDISHEILHFMSTRDWVQEGCANRRILESCLAKALTFVVANAGGACNGSGTVLLCNNQEARDALRSYLIEKRVYGAVHWPRLAAGDAQEAPKAHDWASRMLYLHTDARYGQYDMQRVADLLLGWSG